MSSLRFAEYPALLRNALYRAEQMTISCDFSCSSEKLIQLEKLLNKDETYGLLSRSELMMLLEYYRIQNKNADRLAFVMTERCALVLSKTLYQYWQAYYDNSIVKSVCRTYVRKMNAQEIWQKDWIHWLYFRDPSVTATQIFAEDTVSDYEQLCKNFLLKKDTLLEQRVKIFYYQFCSEAQFKQISDETLCELTERLSEEEKHQFLNRMFRRFPLILKDGRFADKKIRQIYTRQYPLTTEVLLKSAKETNLILLLRNYMIASKIPEKIHGEYWGEHFLSFHSNWKEYHYILHPNALEVICTDQYAILDFWKEGILILFPVELSSEILSTPLNAEQIQQKFLSSEAVHVIQGDHWRSKMDTLIKKIRKDNLILCMY